MTRDIIVNAHQRRLRMNRKSMLIWMVGLVLTSGCNRSGSAAPTTPQPATPAPIIFSTEAPPGGLPTGPTSIFTPSATPVPPVAPNFCNDPQTVSLIDALKRAVLNSDGP